MTNFLYRLVLTFNAISLIIAVYLVKSQDALTKFFPCWPWPSRYLSYFIYFAVPVITTYASILLSNLLATDQIISTPGAPAVTSVEQANNAYLPSYLGYFFVALSVPYCDTLVFVFLILFIFTFLSQTLYFNPLFLLFGYGFFYITTPTNIKIFVITRKNLKDPGAVSFEKLKRINDSTFIDSE